MSDERNEFDKLNQDLFARVTVYLGGSAEDAAMRGLVQTDMTRERMTDSLNALANVAASIISPQPDEK
jgi:hypothetical protein